MEILNNLFRLCRIKTCRNIPGGRGITTFFLAILLACNPDNQKASQKMKATFVRSQELKGYPSGSTISFHENRLYLMGDDALSLQILDTGLQLKQEIRFFNNEFVRIAKAEKADIESSEWIVTNNKAQLWLFGSGSLSPQRDSAFHFDPETQNIERIDLGNFYQKLRETGIAELNLEAAALINDLLLFGSRGNLTNPQNYLIQTNASDFPAGSAVKKIPIDLPDGAGISGMSYLPDHNILFITASKENTATAYDDGEIGESYLGAIYKFSDKLSASTIYPDEWIVLSTLHPDFIRQKIESICTLKSGSDENIIAILVSDDDKGGTRLFSLTLDFKE
jgi:hypothetical protein